MFSALLCFKVTPCQAKAQNFSFVLTKHAQNCRITFGDTSVLFLVEVFLLFIRRVGSKKITNQREALAS